MSKRAGDDLEQPGNKRAALPPQNAHFSRSNNKSKSKGSGSGSNRRDHRRSPPRGASRQTDTFSSQPYDQSDDRLSSLPSVQDGPRFSSLPSAQNGAGFSHQPSSTLPNPLPSLPPLSAELSKAPFLHKSSVQHSRFSTTQDMSYERLEFLGDAYIELFATKIIFPRFHYLPAGQMSQVRELLVKNETLAEYSRAYNFDKNIAVDSLRHMEEAGAAKFKGKGNKGITKIYGDVFEAYLAAVVLSDPKDGEAVAEKWAAALWEPRVAAYERANPAPMSAQVAAQKGLDLRKVFNPTAKNELAKLLMSGNDTKLDYQPWKPLLELKGDQIGQNRHFIGVYLTGYGCEKKLLGKGEGKNKQEAGQWAATDAMHGENKDLVAEFARQGEDIRRRRRIEEAKPDTEVKPN